MVIVAAVDQSKRAKAVVQEAETVARAFDEPIHVVFVLNQQAFLELTSTRADAGDPIEMDEIRSAATKIAKSALESIHEPGQPVGLVGSPGDRIVEYAEKNDVRYIVVGGRKRSPAGKAIFGSVTQKILLNAPCPVISTIEKEASGHT